MSGEKLVEAAFKAWQKAPHNMAGRDEWPLLVEDAFKGGWQARHSLIQRLIKDAAEEKTRADEAAALIEQLQARLAEAEGVRVGQVKAAVGLIHASLFHLRVDDAAEAYHLKAEAFICAAASWLAGR